MQKITSIMFAVAVATRVSGMDVPATVMETRRSLSTLSDQLLAENNLDISELENVGDIGKHWIDKYLQPMLIAAYGFEGTWQEIVETTFDYIEEQRKIDIEYCRVVAETLMPYAGIPFMAGGAEYFLDPKVSFPSYDIDNGETGVFDLNKPMSVNGTLQYVPVDQIGKVKDTGVIRIALVGDWGAGTAESMQMTEYLDSLEEEIHYTFHLGDVYYTGSEEEVDHYMLGKGSCPSGDRKLTNWHKGSRGTFAANGNHEMYTRGHGYFGNLLPANNQKASYGLFQSEFWNFFILDSAYNCLPEIEGIESLIAFFAQVAGNPQAEMPDQIKQWMEDPRLNLFNPEANQTVLLAQHMQLVQPFADPDGFGTTAHQTEEEFWDVAVGTNTRYVQRLLKNNGFDDGYTMAGVWGHDHKSASFITDIPAAAEDQIDVTLLGQLMGQGGFAVDAPTAQPRFADKFGMQWYDSELYKNITTGLHGEQTSIGYNGWNIITIDGPRMKLEYFRSTPFNKDHKSELVGYRVLESLGKNLGAREVESWTAPSIQTTF